MNQVLEAIKTRRSIRSFSDKPISQEDLAAIVEAGQFAPTAMNRQEFQFTVVTNKQKLSQLAQAIREEIGADAGYCFYGPNALIMLSCDPKNHNGMLDCACALENIFLAAHALGIGSVWINQLRDICDRPAIRAILDDFGVPSSHVVWGMAALGYADGPQPAAPSRVSKVVYVK